MIKQLTINNFQSHKETTLDFHPGINAIIGQSDSGKSVILRGLNWVINNKPTGDSFVSYWAKNEKGKIKDDCFVSVQLENSKITRKKSANFNGYIQDAIEYEAIRSDVPEAVQKTLNISEVNIQKQISLPFLISKTSGEIARFLNKLIKLDSIDKALFSIGKKQRKTKTDLKYTEENIVKYKADLKKLDWVDNFGGLVEQAEKLQEKQIELSGNIDNIKGCIDTYKNNKLNIKYKYAPIVAIEGLLNQLVSRNTLLVDKAREKADIAGSLDDYENNIRGINESEKYIKIDDNKYLFKLNEIKGKINDLKIKKNNLKTQINSYNITGSKMELLKTKIEADQDKLPDVCPMCKGTGKLNGE